MSGPGVAIAHRDTFLLLFVVQALSLISGCCSVGGRGVKFGALSTANQIGDLQQIACLIAHFRPPIDVAARLLGAN